VDIGKWMGMSIPAAETYIEPAYARAMIVHHHNLLLIRITNEDEVK